MLKKIGIGLATLGAAVAGYLLFVRPDQRCVARTSIGL